MNRYIWITIFVLALILILGWKQAGKESPVVIPEQTESELPEGVSSGEPIVSESGNIKVTEPRPDSKVSSPLLVKGEARAFESTFQIMLKDGSGQEVARKTVTYTAEDPSQFGSYGELLVFETPATNGGTLEVFTYSAKDGAVQDLVTIPVRFK